jgi:DNA helicase-2/ATP-dependent DNA helicase PcrA
MIANAIVQRYPLIVCDEHQDSSVEQHAIIMAFHDAGARLRIFGDPMQRIYAKKGRSACLKDEQRWADLCKKADSSEVLDTPHRWATENRELGEWICGAREALRSTGKIDLRGALPRGVQIIFADNRSSRHGDYQITKEERGPIDAFVRSQTSLLILTAHNDTIRSLRAFFGRRLPIWEGHTRDAINSLVETVQTSKGNAVAIAGALSGFMFKISRGFAPASYGRTLLKEVESQCSGRRRGKPATLQALARLMLDAPNHIGVSQVLRRLEELTRTDPAFRDIKIDLYREFWEAVKLADFDDPEEGLVEITRRRSRAQVGPPRKAISTVHKAKGLECDSVLIMPCDDKQFSEANRCLLYVALSRAKKSLQIVVSRQNPSPLLELP